MNAFLRRRADRIAEFFALRGRDPNPFFQARFMMVPVLFITASQLHDKQTGLSSLFLLAVVITLLALCAREIIELLRWQELTYSVRAYGLFLILYCLEFAAYGIFGIAPSLKNSVFGSAIVDGPLLLIQVILVCTGLSLRAIWRASQPSCEP